MRLRDVVEAVRSIDDLWMTIILLFSTFIFNCVPSSIFHPVHPFLPFSTSGDIRSSPPPISLRTTTLNIKKKKKHSKPPLTNATNRPLRPRLLRQPHRPPLRRTPLHDANPPRPRLLPALLDRLGQPIFLHRRLQPGRRHRRRLRLVLLPTPRLFPRPHRAGGRHAPRARQLEELVAVRRVPPTNAARSVAEAGWAEVVYAGRW